MFPYQREAVWSCMICTCQPLPVCAKFRLGMCRMFACCMYIVLLFDYCLLLFCDVVAFVLSFLSFHIFLFWWFYFLYFSLVKHFVTLLCERYYIKKTSLIYLHSSEHTSCSALLCHNSLLTLSAGPQRVLLL